MSVNVSARTLGRARFAEQVIAVLAELGVPPERLIIEITETALLTDPPRAAAVLAQLDAVGVRVSLDDFGIGQTSLGYLSSLPVHELKIDKSFVMDMLANPAHAAIVRSIVDLGHNLSCRSSARASRPTTSRHPPLDGMRPGPGLPAGPAHARRRAGRVADRNNRRRGYRNRSANKLPPAAGFALVEERPPGVGRPTNSGGGLPGGVAFQLCERTARPCRMLFVDLGVMLPERHVVVVEPVVAAKPFGFGAASSLACDS